MTAGRRVCAWVPTPNPPTAEAAERCQAAGHYNAVRRPRVAQWAREQTPVARQETAGAMEQLTVLRSLPSRARARLLGPILRLLASAGVTPNTLSVSGLLGNILAGLLVARGELPVGGAVMLLASGLDLLDGALARETGRVSRFGALLDSTLDRLSEAAVLFGVLLQALNRGHDEQAVLACAHRIALAVNHDRFAPRPR